MNDSKPWRLVARLDNPSAANEVATALRSHFAGTSADWSDQVPDIVSVSEVVAIHHPTRGQFGDAVTSLLAEREAEVSGEENRMLTLTATFRLPMGKPGEQLAKELHSFFDQASTTPTLASFKPAPFQGVVFDHADVSEIAWAHEGSLFELHLPLSPAALDGVKKLLISRKVEQLKLRLCADNELERLRKTSAKPSAPKASGPAAATASASLPTVGKRFLFTGKMASLVRDDAKKRVQWLGGVSASSVSSDLDYLVVGDDGSPLYGAGAKGSKILAAEKLIAHGSTLKIISEKQFLDLKRH